PAPYQCRFFTSSLQCHNEEVTEYLEKVLAYGEAHHFPEDAVATVCRIHDSIMDETTI
ncbi:hypothetical protein PV325_012069, partial [Microctonus aethiopoides]